MAAHAAVARGDERYVARTPGCEHPLDCGRRQLGPVREDDHGRFDARIELRQATAKRGSWPALPLRAMDGAFEGMCSRDDDDLVDAGQPFEDVREE